MVGVVRAKPGNGRPPVGVERMQRIYFFQQWLNLSESMKSPQAALCGTMMSYTTTNTLGITELKSLEADDIGDQPIVTSLTFPSCSAPRPDRVDQKDGRIG
jgi:hypothetical protein